MDTATKIERIILLIEYWEIKFKISIAVHDNESSIVIANTISMLGHYLIKLEEENYEGSEV